MKKLLSIWLLAFCCVLAAAASDLRGKLESLKDLQRIEKLETDLYPEKYLVRITQPVDHKNSSAGTFQQRVVVFHAGFDRPTVLVTEGYGGEYAMNEKYQEELSKLFNTNVIFVEYRYFLESTPEPKNWDYLTVENSLYDLHHIVTTFKQIYPGKWISTGISKGGQTTMFYRTYFPDDVDFSVPYVAPLNRGVEDGRHEQFLRKVGTTEERQKILDFQIAVLKHRSSIVPMLETYTKEKGYQYRISPDELLDFAVLEYPFALWQWGTPVSTVPASDADDKALFDHLMEISEPSYFAEGQPYISFNVQAARELGYYGYDTEPLKEYLSIQTAKGYLNRIMLPKELVGQVEFRPELYNNVCRFLKDNDPKMIYIYGENDPWSATRVPDSCFEGKKNLQLYIQPGGSHRARISNMPEEMKQKIMRQIEEWLRE